MSIMLSKTYAAFREAGVCLKVRHKKLQKK